jgi:tetratricopeptide (TPR) repeat protein
VFAAAGGAVWWFGLRPADDPFARGRAAAQAGDFDLVRHCLARLGEAGRADEAALLRGELLLLQGQPKTALVELQHIPHESPFFLDGAVLAGRCLTALKDFAAAAQIFTTVLAERPDDIDAHRGLATVYYDLGNVAQARREAEEVARLDPRDGRPYRLIGLIHKDFSRIKPAIDAYREALARELTPQARREVRLELAECLAVDGQFAQALAQLEGWEAEPGQVPMGLAIQGTCLAGLGRLDEAAHLLDAALRDHPDNSSLLQTRGRVHLDAGDPKAAVPLLEQAARLDPANYQAIYRLALAYQQTGATEQARAQHEQARELKDLLAALSEANEQAMLRPQDGAVRRRAAGLCDKLGKPELAKMWRQAAAACERAAAKAPN